MVYIQILSHVEHWPRLSLSHSKLLPSISIRTGSTSLLLGGTELSDPRPWLDGRLGRCPPRCPLTCSRLVFSTTGSSLVFCSSVFLFPISESSCRTLWILSSQVFSSCNFSSLSWKIQITQRQGVLKIPDLKTSLLYRQDKWQPPGWLSLKMATPNFT